MAAAAAATVGPAVCMGGLTSVTVGAPAPTLGGGCDEITVGEGEDAEDAAVLRKEVWMTVLEAEGKTALTAVPFPTEPGPLLTRGATAGAGAGLAAAGVPGNAALPAWWEFITTLLPFRVCTVVVPILPFLVDKAVAMVLITTDLP